jgi:hypothetical protein
MVVQDPLTRIQFHKACRIAADINRNTAFSQATYNAAVKEIAAAFHVSKADINDYIYRNCSEGL